MMVTKYTALFALGLLASAFGMPSSPPDPSYIKNCPGPMLPPGYGSVPNPDTPEAFLDYTEFKKAAFAASAPPGYDSIFVNLKSPIKGPNYYLGYHALKDYSISDCAEYCEETDGCEAFNIFFERSPKVDPNPKCKNPPSTTLITCSLWSLSPGKARAAASNDRGWRYEFHVVIAGSNGYIRGHKKDCPGYKIEYFGDSAINAPVDCKGEYTYMGYKRFDAGGYDVARCAKACSEQNEYNSAHPPTDGSKLRLCHFTNSYIEKKNGIPQAQYCALYSKAWHKKQATNNGQWQGKDHITISYSVGLTNVTGKHDACV
ncbi:hypothetical protein K458DRAFT_420551 [Lentithecium fluviatile CBS 122367]|uniref:Apple domain-containing protein n=1 Tax=Lentithecium fluviatile CBS 122367 TaxID=1168545 RepID=A0A6G1IU64_9PLEO|nr:hypothetical protein K458DRAFT_420551 [Lentithecium fluviatile CBS 122367]